MHPKLRLFQSHQQPDDKNIRGPRKQEQQAMNDRGPSIGATSSNNNTKVLRPRCSLMIKPVVEAIKERLLFAIL
jgi:hypothetical protein